MKDRIVQRARLRLSLTRIRNGACVASRIAVIFTAETATSQRNQGRDEDAPRVQALSASSEPEGGPFPSDLFTLPGAGQNTGRRVSMPYPDCLVRISAYDLNVIRTLDGFCLQTRISTLFDAPIGQPRINGNGVLLVPLGSQLPGADPDGFHWESTKSSGIPRPVRRTSRAMHCSSCTLRLASVPA